MTALRVAGDRSGPLVGVPVDRQTGPLNSTTTVVVNEPRRFEPGQWRLVIDRLVVSGRFRLVVSDGPLALLELTSP